MVLTQRTLTKDLENPMIFPKFKRDSKNYNIQSKSHKNLKLSLFAQRVFNLHMKRWELCIEKSHGSLAQNCSEKQSKIE